MLDIEQTQTNYVQSCLVLSARSEIPRTKYFCIKCFKIQLYEWYQLFFKTVSKNFARYTRFGTIDVSIQNAGVITIDYYDRMPKADFEKVLAVNTTGVWLCCREAAKYMVKQNHGSLINTSSGQGRQGFIYTPHYAASKMGVIGITQSLAHELAPWNITVNAFCPGIIESEMWDYNDRVWGEILSTEQKRYGKGELMAEWVEGIPMKRAGKPEDVAGLVAFLASDDARYLTGQTINIDGGLIMS